MQLITSACGSPRVGRPVQEVMTMTAKRRAQTPRAGGAADLREKKPRGPEQFARIVGTPTSNKRSRDVAETDAPPLKGFTAKDIAKLKKTEERYAESRRAATVNGRHTFYD